MAVLVAFAGAFPGPGAAEPGVPYAPSGAGIALSPRTVEIRSGSTLRLAGSAAHAPPGSAVRLFASAYPYRTSAPIASAETAADGSFAFPVRPDRSTRYRVLLVGSDENARSAVRVLARSPTRVTALPLGRVAIAVVVLHPRDLRWSGARVRWSFATGRRGAFLAAAATRARRLSPYATLLRAVVSLPAGRFRWRACFSAAEDLALADPERPPGCRGRGYEGRGSLPAGFPGAGAIGRAAAFLDRRAGRTAFAVLDSEGRLSGEHLHRTFVSASVVKAMLLVGYLRMLDARGRHVVDAASNAFLYPMINVSDNAAATRTWSILGNAGLYAVARAAGMTDYSVSTDWASSQISAADQARFFFGMPALIPREFVGYADALLSGIAAYESWGIPAVARPRGYAVFFKGGWRGTALGQLVHQAARLEGHGRTLAIAVMTDGDPSMGYGIDTIQGVTGALLPGR